SLVVVWKTQADHLDVGTAGLLDSLGGAGDGRRAYGHDQLDRRKRIQDRAGLLKRLRLEIVAGAKGGQLDLRVFLLAALFAAPLPLDHGRRGERGGDDGKLALAAQDARGIVHEGPADPFRRGLVDEEIPGAGLGVGIPGEDLDPALACLAQYRRDPLAVLH